MPVSDAQLDIQKLLITRLRRRVEALEEERDRLIAAMRKLSSETAARIYMLEEERDTAVRQARMFEEQLAKGLQK